MTYDKPVFSTDDLPGRLLRVHRTLPANVKDLGALLQHARQDVYREVAAVLARDECFVKLTPSDGNFVSLRVDCVVLTTDEYEALCRTKFLEGVGYARRLLP